MTTEIKSFRDPRVWKAGMDLVEQVYRLTERLPRQELYGLASQMQRAAVSVPSNIAEGHTREYGKEYIHHLSVAQGSLAKLQTQLKIAGRLGYISTDQLQPILEQSSTIAKQIYALRNAVLRSLIPNTQHL